VFEAGFNATGNNGSMLFKIAGSEKMRIAHTTGNVGIGTTSPDSLLHVYGATTAYAKIETGDGSTNPIIMHKNPDRTWHAGLRGDTSDSYVIRDATESANRFVIDSAGAVRIGHSSFTANTSADDLIVGNTNSGVNRGITILNHSGADGRICFADANDDDRGMIKYVHASDIMQFFVNGSEKMHISSTGFIKGRGDLANLNNSSGPYHELNGDTAHNILLSMKHGSSNGYGMIAQFNHANTGIYAYRVHDYANNSDKAFIRTDGDFESANSSYGGISDVKLKENIVDASSQWNDIKAVKVRNFNFKSSTNNTKMLGLIAQEAETVCPSLVKTVPDLSAENEDLGTETKVLKYSILYMKAVKALQEAITKIETLETKVAALEAA
jgi:hypothetical protein